ncbi:hypothetical protein [Sulfitobacter sp.]|jgi:uncharacterized protein involved in propanediol utilization|uniref:hypothetical protein n=1 Tax=Sulfitobacter sp. TaxID=1903071 RepID=UPI0039E27AD9
MRTLCENTQPIGRTGRAAGHFGEWLQGRLGPDGPVVVITMTCDVLYAQATYTPATDLRLRHSGVAAVTQNQLQGLLSAVGKPDSGDFSLSGNMTLGVGAGSSTASLIALARAAGADETLLPAACLRVEGATDPLMLSQPDAVLWSSRQAEICGKFKAPPRCEIVGGYLGDPIRTDPADSDFADISDLVPLWAKAANGSDLAGLAMLASEAADRTTRLRGPSGDPSAAIAQQLGALGHARAHTGSARAFIFAQGAVPAPATAVLKGAGLTGAFRFSTGSEH